MPTWVMETFEYLVGMYMHPGVTAVVFLILLVSRVKFEEPYIQAAKDAIADAAKSSPDNAAEFLKTRKEQEHLAEMVSRYTYALATMLSFAGQFAFYWPKSGQSRALCAFFSFAQIGSAMLMVFFVDKFGFVDRFGKYLQKKADEKIGV